MLDFSLMAEQPFCHAAQYLKSLVLRVMSTIEKQKWLKT